MELIKKVDAFLETPLPVDPPRVHRGFYPSAASCSIKNEYDENITVGKCIRDSYWSCKSVKPSNPMTARGRRITSVGKMVEEWEVARYKEMGIWRGNNVKFVDEENNISGEIDAFVFDESINKVVGVEIKTGYGYQFQKEVMGGKFKKGTPKPEHLMQVMIYLNYFKMIPYFKMVYIDRGNAARIEFTVTLDKSTGGAIVDGKKIMQDITVPSILARYKKLEEYLSDNTIPPRDYELQYSLDRISFLCDSGRLTKTDTEAFKKTGKVEIGDWACSYCNYKDYCWKEVKHD